MPTPDTVLFGALNQVRKTEPADVARWTRVLAAVPGSRLVMWCPAAEAKRNELEAAYRAVWRRACAGAAPSLLSLAEIGRKMSATPTQNATMTDRTALGDRTQDHDPAKNATASPVGSPRPDVLVSEGFAAWLGETGCSLAVTTYRANKVLLIGAKPNHRVSVFERTFDRPMAVAAGPDRLYLACRHQVWRLEGVPLDDDPIFDRCYIPRLSYLPGQLDVHDLAAAPPADAGGDLDTILVVATRLSAVVRLDPAAGWRLVWKPAFVSALVPEDRCHLNGLALVDGRPRYATAVAQSDVADGWRDHRAAGGIVIDLASDQIIATGLSMPHSPRWHDGRLWLLNAGTGEFGFLDGLGSGRDPVFTPICFCPGYARGLAFQGGTAIVGVSEARDVSFRGLPLEQRLLERGAVARAGLLVIDLATGTIRDHARIAAGAPTELYDVQVIDGVRCPRLDGVLHLILPRG